MPPSDTAVRMLKAPNSLGRNVYINFYERPSISCLSFSSPYPGIIKFFVYFWADWPWSPPGGQFGQIGPKALPGGQFVQIGLGAPPGGWFGQNSLVAAPGGQFGQIGPGVASLGRLAQEAPWHAGVQFVGSLWFWDNDFSVSALLLKAR